MNLKKHIVSFFAALFLVAFALPAFAQANKDEQLAIMFSRRKTMRKRLPSLNAFSTRKPVPIITLISSTVI
jgi:hypothetical protein